MATTLAIGLVNAVYSSRREARSFVEVRQRQLVVTVAMQPRGDATVRARETFDDLTARDV